MSKIQKKTMQNFMFLVKYFIVGSALGFLALLFGRIIFRISPWIFIAIIAIIIFGLVSYRYAKKGVALNGK